MQGKQVEKSEEIAINIPQDSNQLDVYVLQRIEELTQKLITSKPAEPRNFFVLSRSGHNVSICPKLQEENYKEKRY